MLASPTKFDDYPSFFSNAYNIPMKLFLLKEIPTVIVDRYSNKDVLSDK